MEARSASSRESIFEKMLVELIATTRLGLDFSTALMALAKILASVAQKTIAAFGKSIVSGLSRSATAQVIPSDTRGDRETPSTASPPRDRCAAINPPTIPEAPKTTFFIAVFQLSGN